MEMFEEIQSSRAVKNLRLIRYEDLLVRFDEMFRDLCSFVMIEFFRPKPVGPNTSFDDASSREDFNNRWAPWSKEKKRIFQVQAGAQLKKWKYVDSI
jgi:hypothetical protein